MYVTFSGVNTKSKSVVWNYHKEYNRATCAFYGTEACRAEEQTEIVEHLRLAGYDGLSFEDNLPVITNVEAFSSRYSMNRITSVNFHESVYAILEVSSESVAEGALAEDADTMPVASPVPPLNLSSSSDGTVKKVSPRQNFFSKIIHSYSASNTSVASSSTESSVSPRTPRSSRIPFLSPRHPAPDRTPSAYRMFSPPALPVVQSVAATSYSVPVVARPNDYLSIELERLVPSGTECTIWRETLVHLVGDGSEISSFLQKNRETLRDRGAIYLRTNLNLCHAVNADIHEALYPQKSRIISLLDIIMKEHFNPLYTAWYTENDVTLAADRKPVHDYFLALVHEAMLKNKIARHVDEWQAMSSQNVAFLKKHEQYYRFVNEERAEIKLYRLYLFFSDKIRERVAGDFPQVRDALVWMAQRIAAAGNETLLRRCATLKELVMVMDDIETQGEIIMANFESDLRINKAEILGYSSFYHLTLRWLNDNLTHSAKTSDSDFRKCCITLTQSIVSSVIARLSQLNASAIDPRFTARLNCDDKNFYLSPEWADSVNGALKKTNMKNAYKHPERLKRLLTDSVIICIERMLEQLQSEQEDYRTDPCPSPSSGRMGSPRQ